MNENSRIERLRDRPARKSVEMAGKQQRDRRYEDAERDRHHRQVEAMQVTAREREHRAEGHADHEGDREAQPRTQPPLDRPDRADKAADDEERPVPQREQSRVAEQHIETDDRSRDPHGFDADLHPVPVLGLRAAEPQQEGNERTDWHQRHDHACDSRTATPAHGYTFSTAGRPSSPLGRSVSTSTNNAKTMTGR